MGESNSSTPKNPADQQTAPQVDDFSIIDGNLVHVVQLFDGDGNPIPLMPPKEVMQGSQGGPT